ncbi:hypothetical protein V8E51_012023 [Hyaloscypha variabilis]
MKQAFFVAFLSLAARVNGQVSQNATFIAGEIAQISACGLSCLEHTIPEVGCTLANTTCQCSSSHLVTLTGDCMLANCTFAEAIELSKINAAICGLPFQSHNKELRVMTIICAAITYTSVLLRFITRLFVAQTYGMDDWFILAAAISDAVFTYYGVIMEHDGLGDHVRDVNLEVVPQLLLGFYIDENLYLLTIGLVKVSILFFYLRVFPKKSFRLLCWLMIAFCTANMLAFVMVTIFQCRPISFAWAKTSMHEGTCLNYNAAAWTNAGVNILQDFLIVVLPLHELRSLQLCKAKKLGVYAMFGMGSFVCLTSIIRLNSLRTFGVTIDATFSNVPITIWSTVETTLAIVCACLPAIRAGVAILFPTLKTTIYNSSYFSKSSQSQTTRLSKPIILVSHQVSQMDSRISGIDLEPRFVTWRILETAGLEPLSPAPVKKDEDDKMSFVSFVSSVTLSRFSRRWGIIRR